MRLYVRCQPSNSTFVILSGGTLSLCAGVEGPLPYSETFIYQR